MGEDEGFRIWPGGGPDWIGKHKVVKGWGGGEETGVLLPRQGVGQRVEL